MTHLRLQVWGIQGLAIYQIGGRIYHLYIRPSPIYPSLKLIYCLYIVHKSVSEVLVPSTLQKYSIYISVPQKITLKKSLRQKGDDFFTENGDFSSDSQKFVEILVNEKVIFQVICYKWWLFCRNSSYHFWWQFCHLLEWRFHYFFRKKDGLLYETFDK